MNYKTLLIALLVSTLCQPVFAAQWFSKGDRAVVVENTSVYDQSDIVARLSKGTNFLVRDVSGNHVAITESIDGEKVNGWIKKKDVLKLDKDKAAFATKKDDLDDNEAYRFKLPEGVPTSIKIVSDYAIDIFIVDEENEEAYRSAVKNAGKGSLNASAHKMDFTETTLQWDPSSDEKYYLVIDNTPFPKDGAESNREITYSLALCIDDPRPEKREEDKGIIIGKATLAFDDYKGKNGEYQGSYNVIVESYDPEEDTKEAEPVDTFKVTVNPNGYFFLENVDMDYAYRIVKIKGSSLSAPVPMLAQFGFGKEDDEGILKKSVSIGGASISVPCAEPSVLDVGDIALHVNSEGNIQGRVSAAHAFLEKKGDSVKIGFSGRGPLERHDWFIKRFSESDWSKIIKHDRDEVYEMREKEKEEEEKEEENTDKTA